MNKNNIVDEDGNITGRYWMPRKIIGRKWELFALDQHWTHCSSYFVESFALLKNNLDGEIQEACQNNWQTTANAGFCYIDAMIALFAMKKYKPSKPWVYLSSPDHATVWDQERTFVDATALIMSKNKDFSSIDFAFTTYKRTIGYENSIVVDTNEVDSLQSVHSDFILPAKKRDQSMRIKKLSDIIRESRGDITKINLKEFAHWSGILLPNDAELNTENIAMIKSHLEKYFIKEY